MLQAQRKKFRNPKVTDTFNFDQLTTAPSVQILVVQSTALVFRHDGSATQSKDAKDFRILRDEAKAEAAVSQKKAKREVITRSPILIIRS